jgi:hypothetical protein
MATRTPIAWNDELQVVVADLDETLAGLYLPACRSPTSRRRPAHRAVSTKRTDP